MLDRAGWVRFFSTVGPAPFCLICPSKKLTCSAVQTVPGDVLGGERGLKSAPRSRDRSAFDQAVFLLVGGTAIEVIRAKVLDSIVPFLSMW